MRALSISSACLGSSGIRDLLLCKYGFYGHKTTLQADPSNGCTESQCHQLAEIQNGHRNRVIPDFFLKTLQVELAQWTDSCNHLGAFLLRLAEQSSDKIQTDFRKRPLLAASAAAGFQRIV